MASLCEFARRRLLCLILPTGLFGVCALSLAQAQPPWLEQYDAAVEQLRSGNFASATVQFDTLWKSNSQQYVLANAIGTALDSAGRHEEATEWYRKAIKLNPQYGSALNNLALNYAARNEPAKSRELLREAVQLNRSDEPAYYNLGLIELRLNDFRAAAQAFAQAHQLKAQARDPLLRLAYADFRNGDRADGLHVLDEFAQLPGDREETTLQEAQLLNGAGLHQEALKRIELAEGAKSSPSPLVFEKGAALFGLGRYKEAVEVLTEAAPEEQNLNSALLLGSAQALAGDLPEAVKTLQAAIQLAPQQPEPYYRLALVFMQGYRNQDALQVLTGGLSVIPNSPLLLYAIGVVDEVSGSYEQATTFVRKSLEMQQNQPQVWGLLAELYKDLGQYRQAEESYQTAINLSASPEITAEYADLLVKLGRLDDAEKVLHDALSKGRQDPDLDRALGRLYNAEGRYVRAQGFLERAVSLAPGDAVAHFALATCLQHLGKTKEAQQEYAAAHQQRTARSESARLLRRTLVPLNSSE